MKNFLPAAILALLPLAIAGCESPENPVAPKPLSPTQLTWMVSPDTLLMSGSTVTLSARVRDPGGANVTGTPVTFTTNAGTLDQTTVTTDGTGFATVRLTGSQEAYVTATTTSTSGAVTVPAVAPYRVAVAPGSSVVTVGVPSAMRVTVTPTAGIVSPPGPDIIRIGCGAGAAMVPVSGMAGSCTFAQAGDALVSVDAATSNGFTARGSTLVSVTAVATTPTPTPAPTPAPAPATLVAEIGCTATTALRVNCNVQSLTYGTTQLAVGETTDVEWEWGDGDQVHTPFPIGSHVFPQGGKYTIFATVTARTADGSKTAAPVSIAVTAAP